MNNYKLLPALISILTTRNLTESAKDLNVTQSAMSKTLSQIRQAFDDEILIREGSQFVLTFRGEQLKARLPVLMQQLDDLYLPNTLNLTSCCRVFRFASSDYVAQAVFPEILKQVEKEAPNIGIEYLMWGKEKLVDASINQLDLVTSIIDTVPENLYGQLMAEDQSVVIISASHALADQPLLLEDYLSARHILISGGGDKDSLIDQALKIKGQERKIIAQVPFFQSAIELLLSTNSMLTVPLHIAAEFSKTHTLKIKPLPVSVKPHKYYLLWHAKYQQDFEHAWLRELCLPILKNHLETRIQQGMKLLHDSQ
ncbi:MAG: LysR family transcriptional regulator [Oleispira antarctica]|nr:LysR family transcriptional regulator [Oleispira antarctica]MBQ0791335.1 LysR family transcriptional regulator [Oleispira antarctica]